MGRRIDETSTLRLPITLLVALFALVRFGPDPSPTRVDHRHEGDHALVLGPSPVEAAGLEPGEIAVEYIAHACFRFFGPDGTVLLIDPFADRVWIPLNLPIEAIRAFTLDAVLITHPHYDHDAGRFIGRPFPFSDEVAIIDGMGSFHVGEFEITGVGGRHAEPYGAEFGRINTVFVIEVDGLRIAHVGDNGPLSTTTARGMGDVDILMMPIDGNEHLLSMEEVDEMIRTVGPRVVVPMHYEHPDLGDTSSLGPIDPWLDGREGVRRLDDNVDVWSREGLPEEREVRVFEHSPLVSSSFATAEAAISPTPSTTPTPTPTPSVVPTPSPTLTPLGYLGWRRIAGQAYAHTIEPGRELEDVRIRCTLARAGRCSPEIVSTGADGAFEFDVELYDRDVVTLVAERAGFGRGSTEIDGESCLAECPEIDIVLEPRVILPWVRSDSAAR